MFEQVTDRGNIIGGEVGLCGDFGVRVGKLHAVRRRAEVNLLLVSRRWLVVVGVRLMGRGLQEFGFGQSLDVLRASPNTPTAREMFFTACSPISAKASDSLSLIWSLAAREMHSPPGSQRASRRAAILTPSPKMSSPSMMISPTLMPMRKTMRLSSATPALRLTMPRWITTAHPTASTTLANSTSAPSPVVLTIRPR